MELGDVEKILKALDSSISLIRWRLRPSAKRRLETDILSLCTGLRPVIMVDYGGKMPELQDHLCAMMSLIQKESTIFLSLRLMVIEDMIYIIHLRGIAEHALASVSSQLQLNFVNLEHDPLKMMLHTEQNEVVSELLSIQKLFSSVFNVDEVGAESSEPKTVDPACVSEHKASQPFEVVDLSRVVEDTQITIPTVNGWLLGYPVVYLFSKDHASDAIYGLSTKSLHIYKIILSRNQTSGRNRCEEELMSFTVPCDLSLGKEKEPWAEAFLARLSTKFETCRPVWSDMRLEVEECYPQSVVL